MKIWSLWEFFKFLYRVCDRAALHLLRHTVVFLLKVI
jgi:hypothetical protein